MSRPHLLQFDSFIIDPYSLFCTELDIVVPRFVHAHPSRPFLTWSKIILRVTDNIITIHHGCSSLTVTELHHCKFIFTQHGFSPGLLELLYIDLKVLLTWYIVRNTSHVWAFTCTSKTSLRTEKDRALGMSETWTWETAINQSSKCCQFASEMTWMCVSEQLLSRYNIRAVQHVSRYTLDSCALLV